MGAIFSKLGQVFLKGGKAVATGNTQASLGLQSPHLASAAVRIGRFLYVAFGGWVGLSWYTGYVNERTKTGEVKWVLPGASTLPVINSPDRPNKKVPLVGGGGGGAGGLLELGADVVKATGVSYSQPTGGLPTKGRKLVAITAQQLGTPGIAGYLWSAPSGTKQIPEYSPATYRALLPVASAIEKRFGLKFTSGYRPNSTGSLHGAGLAFDQVGRMSDMKRAASWAAENPGLFQEIFIHDAGSGLHLHLGFYPDAATIYNAGSSRYGNARPGQAPAPAASRLQTTRA